MRKVLIAALGALCMVQSVAAEEDARQAIRQNWLLCQAGHIEMCERILRSQLDDETRMLVEADRQFAREKIAAHVRGLLTVCETRSSVRACDRALSYSLTPAERHQALTTRKSVTDRGLIRVSR